MCKKNVQTCCTGIYTAAIGMVEIMNNLLIVKWLLNGDMLMLWEWVEFRTWWPGGRSWIWDNIRCVNEWHTVPYFPFNTSFHKLLLRKNKRVVFPAYWVKASEKASMHVCLSELNYLRSSELLTRLTSAERALACPTRGICPVGEPISGGQHSTGLPWRSCIDWEKGLLIKQIAHRSGNSCSSDITPLNPWPPNRPWRLQPSPKQEPSSSLIRSDHTESPGPSIANHTSSGLRR